MLYLLTSAVDASVDLKRALIRNDVFVVNIYSVEQISDDCEMLFIDARKSRHFGIGMSEAVKDMFPELETVVFTSREDGGSERFKRFERADLELQADDIDFAAYEASHLIYDFDYDATAEPSAAHAAESFTYCGLPLELSELERGILTFLLYNKGRHVSAKLLESVCFPDSRIGKSALRAAIHSINERSRGISGRAIIYGVRGKGYITDEKI